MIKIKVTGTKKDQRTANALLWGGTAALVLGIAAYGAGCSLNQLCSDVNAIKKMAEECDPD